MNSYTIKSFDEAEEMLKGFFETIEELDFSSIGEHSSFVVRMNAQLDFAQLIFNLYGSANGQNVDYIFARLMLIFNIDLSDQEDIDSLTGENYFSSIPYTFRIACDKILSSPNSENKMFLLATLKVYELLCNLISIDNSNEDLNEGIDKYIKILNDRGQSIIADSELIDSEEEEEEDDDDDEDEDEDDFTLIKELLDHGGFENTDSIDFSEDDYDDDYDDEDDEEDDEDDEDDYYDDDDENEEFESSIQRGNLTLNFKNYFVNSLRIETTEDGFYGTLAIATMFTKPQELYRAINSTASFDVVYSSGKEYKGRGRVAGVGQSSNDIFIIEITDFTQYSIDGYDEI